MKKKYKLQKQRWLAHKEGNTKEFEKLTKKQHEVDVFNKLD